MAVKPSAFSHVFSFLKPFTAAQPLTVDYSRSPASPKTPICKEGRGDSSTSAAAVKQQRVFVVSPPVSPFTASVAKEKSSCIIDPAAFLIERLEKGWFEENVVGIIDCWGIYSTLSWPGGGGGGGQGRQGQPTTSDLMLWVPANLSDSELFLGPPSGILTPNSGSSCQQHLFPTIEMASTSGNSSATDRDPRDLPGCRLRRLPKVYPDNQISLSDGEQRHLPLSFRTQSTDLPEALQQFSDKQSEIRNSSKMERPSGKLEGGSSDKERRRAQKHDSSAMPGAPTRRRRKDRRRSSRSLTEGEYDEFRALGFNSARDDHTSPVTGEFPGLKFYTDGANRQQQSPDKSSHRSRFRYPKGWTTHPDSPLLKGHIPSNLISDVDLKAQLQFWAHSVASTVSAEC